MKRMHISGWRVRLIVALTDMTRRLDHSVHLLVGSIAIGTDRRTCVLDPNSGGTSYMGTSCLRGEGA